MLGVFNNRIFNNRVFNTGRRGGAGDSADSEEWVKRYRETQKRQREDEDIFMMVSHIMEKISHGIR